MRQYRYAAMVKTIITKAFLMTLRKKKSRAILCVSLKIRDLDENRTSARPSLATPNTGITNNIENNKAC